MPEIGTIKGGQELNRKDFYKYSWLPCENCGKERWVALVRKQPRHRICRDCSLAPWRQWREKNHCWKGGRKQTKEGYILIRIYEDDFFFSMAQKGDYVVEHRLVMAKHLGRNLHRWEIVHHKGTKYPKGSKENRSDNRIENLQLVTDDRHRQITLMERRIKYLEKRVTLLEAENILLKTGKELLL